jgi:hypothetical protein
MDREQTLCGGRLFQSELGIGHLRSRLCADEDL